MNDRESAIAAYHETLLRAAEYGDPEIDRLLKRQLAQSDLFFLLTHVLGRADLDRDWYFARCREVQGAPNGHLFFGSGSCSAAPSVALACRARRSLRRTR